MTQQPEHGTASFLVDIVDDGARLDAFVAKAADVSRAVAARLIGEGSVLVDGDRPAKSLRVQPGMRVDVALPEAPSAPQAEDIPLRVVYEDESMLVISKPAGLVVHPAPGHEGGTLVNALLARAAPPVGGDAERPGIVHRLDAGTSGLMIVALEEVAHQRLTEALAARHVHRTYAALVEGDPDTDTATIDAPIGRSARQRKKMAVVATGKPAVTRVTVLERHGRTAFLDVEPETGRTHQIRVHLAAAGHPIVGDDVYGATKRIAAELGLDRPFLHARRLAFDHPMTGEPLVFDDPLPADLMEALARARVMT